MAIFATNGDQSRLGRFGHSSLLQSHQVLNCRNAQSELETWFGESTMRTHRALYLRGAFVSIAPWRSIKWVTVPLLSLRNSISASITLGKNFVSDSAYNGILV